MISDAEFVKIITFAVDKIGVRQTADELMVSLPTVRRWVDEKSSPHPVMRPAILEWATKYGYR